MRADSGFVFFWMGPLSPPIALSARSGFVRLKARRRSRAVCPGKEPLRGAGHNLPGPLGWLKTAPSFVACLEKGPAILCAMRRAGHDFERNREPGKSR